MSEKMLVYFHHNMAIPKELQHKIQVKQSSKYSNPVLLIETLAELKSLLDFDSEYCVYKPNTDDPDEYYLGFVDA